MKYTVTIKIGTPLWSSAVNVFELGCYRFKFLAFLAAWWHIQRHSFRTATITAP